MHMKIQSVKWRLFCPGGDELSHHVKPNLVDAYLRQEDSILSCFFYKKNHILPLIPCYSAAVVSGQVGERIVIWRQNIST